MKQEDANKLLAAFMVFIMVSSAVAFFLSSPRTESTQAPVTQENKYDPYLWTLSEQFDSISDSLNMTPYGVVTANFIDIDSMTPQMTQWVKQNYQVVNEVDLLYKSNTTKMYFSLLNDGENESFLLLSTIFPEKNDFEYMAPYSYGYHPVLIRQDTGGINILGTPSIYAPDQQTAINVLEIISSENETVTAFDQYEGLLTNVDIAPFQEINSNVNFADQFYRGIRENNGSYERTTAYLNINSSTLEKIESLKANSTEKGFVQYNITQRENYTIVKIATDGPDLFRILFEEFS